MAINRAPFNALVDDDGSNTIGTPWNKAAIAGVILDPVDAALVAAGITQGTWVPLLTGSGGAPVYNVQLGNYVKAGPLVTVLFDIALNSRGTLAGASLGLGGLPFPIRTGTTAAGPIPLWFNFATAIGSLGLFGLVGTSGGTIFCTHAAGASNGALAVADLTDTTRFLGSLVYLT